MKNSWSAGVSPARAAKPATGGRDARAPLRLDRGALEMHLRDQQPGGLPEISRGLRSAERDDTPGRGVCSRILEGCQKFWHPFRVLAALVRRPGVSLRSTPGYFLPALRAADKRRMDTAFVYEC